MIYDDNSDLLLASSAWGLGISTDKDESWRFQTDGLHGKYLRAVAVAGDMILLTASTGPFSKQAAVYRTPVPGKQPVEKPSHGLPDWFPSNVDTHCIAASGDMVVCLAPPMGRCIGLTMAVANGRLSLTISRRCGAWRCAKTRVIYYRAPNL